MFAVVVGFAVVVCAVACSKPTAHPRDDVRVARTDAATAASATSTSDAGASAMSTSATSTSDAGDISATSTGDAGAASTAGAASATSTSDAGDISATSATSTSDAGDASATTSLHAASSVAIVDAPMKWSDERERLTLQYRRKHSDPEATDLTITPKVIVLHYTGGSSAKATRGYFDNLKIEAARKDLARGGAVNVSSHFLVDRDGTIYRLQPETRFARHCIGLNHLAIGIENVGDGKKYPLTDAQVDADAALVRDLAARFPITHLLGHQEVMKFRDNPYYVELDATYRNDKDDPGEKFMQRVRERVADLKLSGL